jgi:hypothetical protein
MFEKFDEAARDVVSASRHECLRSRSGIVSTEHLLLALTRDPMNVAARALATMNIRAENVQEEVDRELLNSGKTDSEPGTGITTLAAFENICFDDQVKRIFERANEVRLFFGRDKVAPEHLLLGIIDLKDIASLKVLDELGANLVFLRRQVLNFTAQDDCLLANAPDVRHTIITGLNELISNKHDSVEQLRTLANSTNTKLHQLPERAELALMCFLAYLPDFLTIQVAFQRYLLEETIKLLARRAGSIDQETTAGIVSSSAQHLRAEVRATIEYIWSHELRMINQLPDEGEHDLIGSVIEDLWWTHSEEIALHEVFDEALDDYRRKQVLNLQKRKVELSQRLHKLRGRLEDTIKQCFLKRSLSA